MATSGTMQGNSVNIGGGPSYFFINWQLAGQNEDGDFSTINWQAYFHFQNSDSQLDNGVANLGGGTRWANGGRVYNYAGNFSTRDLGLASGSFNIGHDGNGNATLGVDGGLDVYQTGRSSGSAAWGLPGLYQAIDFNSISISNVTDIGFTVSCSTNRTSNLLQLNVDGGGFVTYHSGNFSSLSVDVGGIGSPLVSGKNHTVVLRIRRASNGWITDSGTYNALTDVQNKFFDLVEF